MAGIATRFTTWMPRLIEDYGFEADQGHHGLRRKSNDIDLGHTLGVGLV